jgi:transposase
MIKRYESKHPTAWKSLVNAGEWACRTIREKSIPTIEPNPLRYTIESTSTYHLPVLKAFQGKPSVVNPVLAGSSRRKTDKLDARLLSYQSMTGLWPESFVVSPEIQEFRLLVKQRDYHLRECTAITNRINNYILRFGHTLGSYQSVRSMENRALLEDMCSEGYMYADDCLGTGAGSFVCPDGLPDQVKQIILKMYSEYDFHNEQVNSYQKQAVGYAKNVFWETDGGYVKGDKLIKNLLTVPSVGEATVLLWLSEVVTPLRFKTAPQLAAYCGCDPSLKVSAGKVTSQTRRKGNARLHNQLMVVAGACINRHSEPFGQWGYALSKKHAKGGHKKASGAVSRRIAVSMYYVHKHNEAFRYDKYNFYKIDVPDVQVDDMGLSKRVVNLLNANDLFNSKSIADMYITGNIYEIRGFGKKAAQEIDYWIHSNKNHNKA